jgi:hypothetical protein
MVQPVDHGKTQKNWGDNQWSVSPRQDIDISSNFLSTSDISDISQYITALFNCATYVLIDWTR